MKRAVRNFWNGNPCGAQHVGEPIGSKAFFEQYDAFRMKVHPYLANIIRPPAYLGFKVLEVGCGIGSDAAKMAAFGGDVTAFDLSSVSVALTMKRFKEFGLDGNFVVGDAENLPFKNDSYDQVFSIGVLHHTPETAGAVSELHRVLKPKGEAIVMLYYRHSFRYKIVLKTLARVKRHRIERLVAEYDGKENPLGKVFSKKEAEDVFSCFRRLNMCVRNFYPHDIARFFGAFSPLFARLVAGILRRFPQTYFEPVSRIAGTDLYIFATK